MKVKTTLLGNCPNSNRVFQLHLIPEVLVFIRGAECERTSTDSIWSVRVRWFVWETTFYKPNLEYTGYSLTPVDIIKKMKNGEFPLGEFRIHA